MYTRKDYLDGKISHREYYAQFVNEDVKARVSGVIGLTALLKSTNEHLNDIPMKKWDLLAGWVWGLLGKQGAIVQPETSTGLLPVDYKLLKEAGEGASNATMVCIYKEAGKQMIEEHKNSVK